MGDPKHLGDLLELVLSQRVDDVHDPLLVLLCGDRLTHTHAVAHHRPNVVCRALAALELLLLRSVIRAPDLALRHGGHTAGFALRCVHVGRAQDVHARPVLHEVRQVLARKSRLTVVRLGFDRGLSVKFFIEARLFDRLRVDPVLIVLLVCRLQLRVNAFVHGEPLAPTTDLRLLLRAQSQVRNGVVHPWELLLLRLSEISVAQS